MAGAPTVILVLGDDLLRRTVRTNLIDAFVDHRDVAFDLLVAKLFELAKNETSVSGIRERERAYVARSRVRSDAEAGWRILALIGFRQSLVEFFGDERHDRCQQSKAIVQAGVQDQFDHVLPTHVGLLGVQVLFDVLDVDVAQFVQPEVVDRRGHLWKEIVLEAGLALFDGIAEPTDDPQIARLLGTGELNSRRQTV